MGLFKRKMTPADQRLYDRTMQLETKKIHNQATVSHRKAIVNKAKRDAQFRAQSKGSRVVGGLLKAGKALGDFAEKMPDMDKVESAWVGPPKKRKK